jgi:hypothetical protein
MGVVDGALLRDARCGKASAIKIGAPRLRDACGSKGEHDGRRCPVENLRHNEMSFVWYVSAM